MIKIELMIAGINALTSVNSLEETRIQNDLVLFTQLRLTSNTRVHKLIQNKKVRLQTTIYPLQNAETIILLHGGPGVPDAMEEVVNVLKGKYQVVYFEQRGTGALECNTSSFNMQGYISDIDAIAECLQLGRFHLFGHSWGGLYAQIYADQYPGRVKSLFLCSPSSGTNRLWKETEKEVMRFNKRMVSNRVWLKMGWYSLLGSLGVDHAYQKLFKQVYENYHKDMIELDVDEEKLKAIKAAPINNTRREIIKYQMLPVVENASYSICITYGDRDIYGESKKSVLERYPTAKLHEIRKCGHIPWLHNPLEFENILSSFYGL